MTYIKERNLPVDFNEYWKSALRQEDGNYSPRVQSDEEERKFWQRYMSRKGAYAQDETAKTVMNKLEHIMRECDGVDSILEIGPGWGNYTMDLSALCKNLACVDISQHVLDYIIKIATEKKRTNIATYFGKFEDIDLQQKYDVIFGYNCFYRMKNLKSIFKKMNDNANKLCVVGMGMGSFPAYYTDMAENLGLPLISGKKDYIHFVNILYQMGIDANVKIIPLEKTMVYNTFEELMEKETQYLKNRENDFNFHSQAIEEILKNYYKQNEKQQWEWKYSFRGVLVYWHPIQL